jgi:hypothetical protein
LKRIEPHKEFYHDKNFKPTAPEAENEEEAFNDLAAGAQPASDIPGETEGDDVPMRPEEKRRLNWEGGLYLAPLTTVGNLVSPSQNLLIRNAELMTAIPKIMCKLRSNHNMFRNGPISTTPKWSK